MSKKAFILRYGLIVKRLQAKPYSSFADICDYIDDQMTYLQMQDDTLEMGFSKRTFQRDIKEIRNLYGINIEYSKSNNGYYIGESVGESENFKRMIEAFDMYNSLNMSQDLSPYILFEKRQPLGTESFYGILHAIKNRLRITFTYKKFDDDSSTHRDVEPYALKEFKYRWYVMARDKKDGVVKSFGLDRISELEIGATRFSYPKNYNTEDIYRFCFGIIDDENESPEEIILSFNKIQGKYIKSLPIHKSQQIIADNENETRIKLSLKITYDFVIEILSLGNNVKVLQPKKLINELKKIYLSAYKQY